MVTSTALGTASPHRLGEPEVTPIEVVDVATDQAVASPTSIHRLHRPAVLLPAAGAVSASTLVWRSSRSPTG
jgi:hypothetical protein